MGQSRRCAYRGRPRWPLPGRWTPSRRAPPTPCPRCRPRPPTASSSLLPLLSRPQEAIPQTPSLQSASMVEPRRSHEKFRRTDDTSDRKRTHLLSCRCRQHARIETNSNWRQSS
ncbi:unnamed protein product [Urochloa decumbens]|uniref:Uncharacterized protein n=1 Tax=Urochloa decumbens TaxID=240449 RepID=A0ABC8VSB3_9POAL